MQIDIKTSVIQPKRNTFANLAARFGEDRTASRYEEGTIDLQADANFHYRPLWAPEYELFDKRRSRIEMADWYALRDPRQYYYATYNIARAKMHEASDRNFDFVEKRGMLAAMDAAWAAKVKDYLLPLRHFEWGANMTNCSITTYGYGTALTAATCFAMADRLGIAQLVSRIGLALDGNAETALDAAKQQWMNAPMWQDMRRMVEDSLVLGDFFEAFVAQNLAMDGIVYPLVYGVFSAEGDKHGAQGISILSEFMTEWEAESGRWVDAVVKTAAAESAANKTLLSQWTAQWSERAAKAMTPIAIHVLGDAGGKAVADALASLRARAAKLGL